jgi:hypothetical protein
MEQTDLAIFAYIIVAVCLGYFGYRFYKSVTNKKSGTGGSGGGREGGGGSGPGFKK